MNDNHDILHDFTLKALPMNHVVSVTSLVGDEAAARKRAERGLTDSGLNFPLIEIGGLVDEHGRCAKTKVTESRIAAARQRRKLIVFARLETIDDEMVLCYHDARGGRRWLRWSLWASVGMSNG